MFCLIRYLLTPLERFTSDLQTSRQSDLPNRRSFLTRICSIQPNIESSLLIGPFSLCVFSLVLSSSFRTECRNKTKETIKKAVGRFRPEKLRFLNRHQHSVRSLSSRPVQPSCPNPTKLVRIRPSLPENSALPGFSSSCPNILSFNKPNGWSNNPSVRPIDGALSGSKTDPFLALIGFMSESVNGTNAGRKSLAEYKGPYVPADVPADVPAAVPADASSSEDKAPEPSLEIPRKHKIGFPRNFLGIYRRNSKEISVRRNIPRKFRGKMCSSEKTDEFRGNIIAVGGFYKILRKFRRTSLFRQNSVGISSVCRQDLNYKYKHSSSSSFTPYLHPPSYSIYT
ncbi:hypothetical protein YC2023_082570 [Brassica napus]